MKVSFFSRQVGALAGVLLAGVLGLTAGCDGESSTNNGPGGGGAGGTGGGTGTLGGAGGAGGGEEPVCFDYASFDGSQPAVSFKDEVLPVFQRSCGVSTSCHGDINQPNENRPYLGPNKNTVATADQIAAIFAAIVDVQSFYEPGMNLVKTGDPENSFLMHKLDGTLECTLLSCAPSKDCGSLMPQGSSNPLDIAERDAIRRWIAQGAQNN
ncbi:MAG: hypothetical protein R3B70_26130 [Polyangiaceae bacterium]